MYLGILNNILKDFFQRNFTKFYLVVENLARMVKGILKTM